MKLSTLFTAVLLILAVSGCADLAPRNRGPAAACIDKGFNNYHSTYDKYEKCHDK